MRAHLLIASVAILALAVAPAMAAPSWLSLDGDLLGDWGVTPGTQWLPSASNVAYSLSDDKVTASNSGGEWYDIEAVYLRLDVDYNPDMSVKTQWMSWAMVTSYAGNEAYTSYSDGVRNQPYTAPTASGGGAYPYRRNPVIALDFNQGSNVPYWRWGLVVASQHDWTWDGAGDAYSDYSFAGSKGLADTNHSSAYDYWPGDSNWDFDRTLASYTGTDAAQPQLWSVEQDGWRSGRPTYGFPDDPRRRPIDFDTRSSNAGNDNSVIGSNGSAVAVSGYDEGAYYSTIPTNMGGQVPGQSSWRQMDNWIWEGYVEFPRASAGGFNFEDIEDLSFHYGMWCANNHTMGDVADYRAPPPTPELGTWALLLATGATAGWARRRRKG